ncbi:MAG: hypothetical protein ACRDWD_05385, partial [Acidimicrobiia bacterium]
MALHEADDCSWFALLAAGADAGLDAIVKGVNRQARIEPADVGVDAVAAWDVVVDRDAEPAPEPDAVAITKLGTAASYEFTGRRPVELTARR